MRILKQVFMLTILVFSMLLVSSSSHADTVALTLNPSATDWWVGDNNEGEGGTWGFMFGVRSRIEVVSLGAWDEGGDGFENSHDVGLWDELGNLIVSTSVPSGTSAILDGGFRFQPISPVTLVPFVWYYVGAYFLARDDDMIASPHRPSNWFDYIIESPEVGFLLPNPDKPEPRRINLELRKSRTG